MHLDAIKLKIGWLLWKWGWRLQKTSDRLKRYGYDLVTRHSDEVPF